MNRLKKIVNTFIFTFGLLPIIVNASTKINFDVSLNIDYEYKVLELVNAERAKEGLDPLVMDYDLYYKVAKTRSYENALYYSHTRANNTSWSTLYYDIDYSYIAENIAFNYKSPDEVVNAWMNSSGHRANIMNSRFKAIGIGFVSVESNSQDTTYWTQNFSDTISSPLNREDVSLNNGSKNVVVDIDDELINFYVDGINSNIIISVDETYISNNVPYLCNNNSYACTKIDISNVSYKSTDSSIAKVDQNGNITGIKEGTATIIASIADNSKNVNVTVLANEEDENEEDEIDKFDGILILKDLNKDIDLATYLGIEPIIQIDAQVSNNVIKLYNTGLLKVNSNGEATITGLIYTSNKTYDLNLDIRVDESLNTDIYGDDMIDLNKLVNTNYHINKYELINEDVATIVDNTWLKPNPNKYGNIILKAYTDESYYMIFEINKNSEFEVKLEEDFLYVGAQSRVSINNIDPNMYYYVEDVSDNLYLESDGYTISACESGSAWVIVNVVYENTFGKNHKSIRYDFNVKELHDDIIIDIPEVLVVNKEYQINIDVLNPEINYKIKPVKTEAYEVSADGKIIGTALKDKCMVQLTFSYQDQIVESFILNLSIVDIDIKNQEHNYYLGNGTKIEALILPENILNDYYIEYESSDENILTVDENGYVNFIGVGSADVIVSETNYGMEKRFTFNVQKGETSITLNKSFGTLELGTNKVNKDKLIATITTNDPNLNKSITWTSNYPDIVKVDNDGNVEFLGFNGTVIDYAVITAEVSGYKADCVYDLKSYITDVSILTNDIKVEKGSAMIYPIEVYPQYNNDNDFSLDLQNTEIVNVALSKDNLYVYGILEGSTTIKVRFGTIIKDINVEVYAPTTGITFDEESLSLKVGEKIQHYAHLIPTDNNTEDIKYTSTNPEVATIDDNAVITGLKKGTTVIIATYKEFQAKLVVEVSDILLNDFIIKNDNDKVINVGETIPIEIEYIPNNYTENLTINYLSSDSSIATIENGVIKGISRGVATITVKASNGLTKTFDIKVWEDDYVKIGFKEKEINVDWFNNYKLEPFIETNILDYDKTLSWSIKNFGANITINDDGVISVAPSKNKHGYAYIEVATKTKEKATIKVNAIFNPEVSIKSETINVYQFENYDILNNINLDENYNYMYMYNLESDTDNAYVKSDKLYGVSEGKNKLAISILMGYIFDDEFVCFQSKDVVLDINILKPQVTILLPKEQNLTIGNGVNETGRLSAKVTSNTFNYDKTVSWSSTNPEVLWVDNKGNFGFNKWDESLLNENPKVIATTITGEQAQTEIFLTFKTLEIVLPNNISINELETTTINLQVNPVYHTDGINNVYLYNSTLADVYIKDIEDGIIHNEVLTIKGLKAGKTILCISYEDKDSCTNLVVNEPDYFYKKLENNMYGTLTGNFTNNTSLVINKLDNSDISSNFKAYIKDSTIIGLYNVFVSNGYYKGKLSLTFNVNEEYNNKNVIIYHEKKDGTVEEFNSIVENGEVSIEVSELSPFMILTKDNKVENIVIPNITENITNPSTSVDNYNIINIGLFILSILLSVGLFSKLYKLKLVKIK